MKNGLLIALTAAVAFSAVAPAVAAPAARNANKLCFAINDTSRQTGYFYECADKELVLQQAPRRGRIDGPNGPTTVSIADTRNGNESGGSGGGAGGGGGGGNGR